MGDEPKFIKASPTYFVSDLQSAVNYYVDVLGFNLHFMDNSPPVAIVSRGGALFHLIPDGEPARAGRGHSYNIVENLETLLEQYRERGATFVSDIKVEHGMKDFVVSDIDGNHIGFVEQAGTS